MDIFDRLKAAGVETSAWWRKRLPDAQHGSEMMMDVTDVLATGCRNPAGSEATVRVGCSARVALAAIAVRAGRPVQRAGPTRRARS